MKLLFIVGISAGLMGFMKSQNVNIPDANFKAYLVGNSAININGDSEIQISEAEDFTGTIDCSSKDIVNLVGIEAFPNIKTLRCYNNKLTSLNVSKNTALTILHCYNNQLTDLDVSKNVSLVTLMCFTNQLANLDLSKNTVLRYLYCGGNQLTDLDVSKNIMLQTLGCEFNRLMKLDVSKNPMLQTLQCNSNQLTSLNLKNGNNAAISTMYSFNNPILGCIQVDDDTNINIDWQKDSNSNYNTDCEKLSATDIHKKELIFYPNPVKEILNFSDEVFNITITDMSGKIVKQFSDPGKSVNVTNLAKGNYIITANAKSGKVIIRKFIKQ